MRGILTCIESKATYIPDLLTDTQVNKKHKKLQSTIENIKTKFGDKRLAISPCKIANRNWVMSRENLTRDYFSWDGIL